MDKVKINWHSLTTEKNAVERAIKEAELNIAIKKAQLECDPFTYFRNIDKLILDNQ